MNNVVTLQKTTISICPKNKRQTKNSVHQIISLD